MRIRQYFSRVIIFLLWVAAAGFASAGHPAKAAAEIPTPADLVAAVNKYRALAGMPALTTDSRLMTSAQSHAQYLSFIGYLEHKGPGGSNETDRAIAAGYGVGNEDKIICDEALAFTGPGVDINTFFTNQAIWNNYEHRDVIFLNPRYMDIGAGVVEKNGSIYYTVNVCVGGSSAQPSALPSGTPLSGGTTARPPTITPSPSGPAPVLTATPEMDGSIIHVVQQGQTLWHISMAYNVPVIDLATMNNLSPSKPVVYIGQKIRVRLPYTLTPPPTITQTLPPPTRTPNPSRTPQPPTTIPSPTLVPTLTLQPLLPDIPSLQTSERGKIGMVILIISAVGLLVVLSLGAMREKKK